MATITIFYGYRCIMLRESNAEWLTGYLTGWFNTPGAIVNVVWS